MKFIVVTIDRGEVIFISQCKTRRGAGISAAYSKRLSPKADVRILSVDDILAWDDSGLRELQALYKL